VQHLEQAPMPSIDFIQRPAAKQGAPLTAMASDSRVARW
jgi:hypothetical protein